METGTTRPRDDEADATLARPEKRPRDFSWQQEGVGRWRKRPAEVPVERIDPQTVLPEDAVHIDADVETRAQSAAPTTVHDGGETTTTPHGSGVGSMDKLSKSAMREDVRKRVIDQYRHENVDISMLEVEQITTLLTEMCAVDVMEIFSPPRFCHMATQLGLKPGYSIDLDTGWNLSDKTQQRELWQLMEREEPELLTGSPPCTPWCKLMNLNPPKNDEQRLRREEKLELGKHSFYEMNGQTLNIKVLPHSI